MDLNVKNSAGLVEAIHENITKIKSNNGARQFLSIPSICRARMLNILYLYICMQPLKGYQCRFHKSFDLQKH